MQKGFLSPFLAR